MSDETHDLIILIQQFIEILLHNNTSKFRPLQDLEREQKWIFHLCLLSGQLKGDPHP
jgi:hypothetical protein